MGLDGGTYATRADIIRRQSWKISQSQGTRSTRGGSVSTSQVHHDAQVDRATSQATVWSVCTLSSEPLAAPVVCDYLGHLYNRDAIVEFMLARKAVFLDEAAKHKYLNTLRVSGTLLDHLQSMRDVFAVHIATPTSPAAAAAKAPSGSGPAAAATAAGGSNNPDALYVCPVTQLPCGRYPFSALPACGHVLSERALAAVGSNECPLCSQPYSREQLVAIGGSGEQVARLRTRLPLAAAEAAARSSSSNAGSKKKRKRAAADAAVNEPVLLASAPEVQEEEGQPSPRHAAAWPTPAVAGPSPTAAEGTATAVIPHAPPHVPAAATSTGCRIKVLGVGPCASALMHGTQSHASTAAGAHSSPMDTASAVPTGPPVAVGMDSAPRVNGGDAAAVSSGRPMAECQLALDATAAAAAARSSSALAARQGQPVAVLLEASGATATPSGTGASWASAAPLADRGRGCSTAPVLGAKHRRVTFHMR